MMRDEEIVREIYRKTPKKDQSKTWAPQISEMDANLRALGMIYNRLGDVAQAVMSTIQVENGKARPKYKGDPFPQPSTLFEEIARQEARETAQWLTAQFMPHAGGW